MAKPETPELHPGARRIVRLRGTEPDALDLNLERAAGRLDHERRSTDRVLDEAA